MYSNYVSALQAFWPGLQTLAGHVGDAEECFESLLQLWKRYDMLPDMYDTAKNKFLSHSQGYPLRPELVESAYHLYTATGKQKYINFVKDAFHSLQNNTKTECGYAAISDVRTGRLDDRMDSYFFAETLMYTFLLFDEALPADLRESVFCHGKQSEDGADDDVYNSTNVDVLEDLCTSADAELDASSEMAAGSDKDISDLVEIVVIAEGDSSASSLTGTSGSMAATSTNAYDKNSSIMRKCKSGEKKNRTVKLVEKSSDLCISKVSTLFSTEGHLLLIDPVLRPLLARHASGSAVTKGSATRQAGAGSDTAERHTCSAPA
jgi:hypothetical protein